MPSPPTPPPRPTPADILLAAESAAPALPVTLARTGHVGDLAGLAETPRAWLKATGFKPALARTALFPAPDGGLAGAVLGLGHDEEASAVERAHAVGQIATALPAGTYALAGAHVSPLEAAIGFGLGAYRFTRYKAAGNGEVRSLKLPAGVDRARALAIVEGVWLGRDLINTPANDMGPDQLEAAARALAKQHGARVTSIVGDDLLAQGFPMIHAVGRASTRAPRLIDMTWGPEDALKVTLVGKGVCFDTGGLDIKPAAGMLLMKKDMGGAATALGLGHMLMATRAQVRLRILLSVVENAISGEAFRPGDVLPSRAGMSVEIGNTDAEGRLVLADALTLADEERPDLLATFATLTGAARVALGPDLPPFFTSDEALAADIAAAGARVGDPVWRLPLWPAYDRNLDSDVADVNNVFESPFAGAITAALFLKRFVKTSPRYAHFDIYGWRPKATPTGPKGGEPQAARLMLDLITRRYGAS